MERQGSQSISASREPLREGFEGNRGGPGVAAIMTIIAFTGHERGRRTTGAVQ